ncbi:DUF6520 family protein [Siphonobacter curvatus]|nr:DUF6520 family protein [Siphonobacter curvatus]
MHASKVSLAGVFAFVFAAGAALATQQVSEIKSASTEWTRVRRGTTIAWEQMNTTQSCIASNQLCKAVFAEGYDPNEHSNLENEAAAESVIQDNGFVSL